MKDSPQFKVEEILSSFDSEAISCWEATNGIRSVAVWSKG